MKQEQPTVAVIMRSKDEQPYVSKALKRLFRQRYQNFKLYNIDSGSTDGSWEEVKKYHAEDGRLFRIRPEDYVPGKVINDMIARSKESIVVLLNADAIPSNDLWLEKLLAPILDGEVEATMSRQLPRKDAFFIVQYDYQRAYKRENIAGKNPYFFSAVACAFQRSLWEETKFYEEGFSEDVVWAKACQGKGHRFQLVEDSLVEHSHNYTLAQLYRRKYIEAVADVSIYGVRASILEQSYLWLREVVRDLLHATRCLRLWTIPYNLIYRSIAHFGFYMGKKRGTRAPG